MIDQEPMVIVAYLKRETSICPPQWLAGECYVSDVNMKVKSWMVGRESKLFGQEQGSLWQGVFGMTR